jgi:hypothetical protein
MPIKEKEMPQEEMKVKSNSPILLTIIIGNRQIGGSVVEFEGEEPLDKGRIKKLELGKGKAIFDKILLVQSNILDSNTVTNKVVVTHRFHYENDEIIGEYVIEDEVDNHKDIFSVIAKYTFKK